MKLCLLSDRDAVTAAVRAACPAPHRLTALPPTPLVDTHGRLAPDGEAALARAAEADALLVDFALDRAPVLNVLGFRLRQAARVPLVAVCVGGEDEVVAALAAGADDALALPLSTARLQACVLAYRRLVGAAQDAVRAAPEAAAHEVLRHGPLRLDRTARRLTVREEPLELTPREFALLDFLLEHADTVHSRDDILSAVWGIDFETGTNMVDVYVHFLRRKLGAHGLGDAIRTVRGRGYGFFPFAAG